MGCFDGYDVYGGYVYDNLIFTKEDAGAMTNFEQLMLRFETNSAQMLAFWSSLDCILDDYDAQVIKVVPLRQFDEQLPRRRTSVKPRLVPRLAPRLTPRLPGHKKIFWIREVTPPVMPSIPEDDVFHAL
jgi:hypothetical protein